MKWLALVLAVSIPGCRPKPPTPPELMRAIGVVTSDTDTGAVYVDDVGGGHVCQMAQGYCEVTAHDGPTLQQTYLTVKAPGFKDYRQDGVRLPTGNIQIWLGPGCGMTDPTKCVNLPPLEREIVPLPRLVLNGQAFRQETGELVTVIEASGYTLYQRFLDGQDIEPVLAQLENLGFNTVRVFGQYDNAAGIGHFRPEDYPTYWTQRAAFYTRLTAHHLYGEWTVFADATRWTCAQQLDTAQKTAGAFQGISNALVEWVNEADQPINQVCPSVLAGLARVPAVLTSHGSNGSQATPVMPFLDYVTFHTNDASEEERKVGHNCGIDYAPTACLTNEISRAPNAYNWDPTINHEANPTLFAEDASAGAALLAAGSAYHSDAGRAGRLLTGDELTFAAIWVKGAKKVPLSCQNQAYSHRTDLETSGVLRAYQRGPAPSCVVLIRKST